MSWRADRGYEETQAKAFRDWKASLTRSEYWLWQWDRWRYFLAGVASTAAAFGLFRWLLS